MSDGTVYDFCGKPRLYSGASRVTKFPAPSFTAKVTVCVTAKTEGAVDGLFLAGDREVRFGLRLAEERFELVLKDGERVSVLGTLPARELDAGALKAWTSGELVLEARVKPAAADPRQCDVVFACKDIVSPPVRLANSIWQGVKIGLAAEPVKSPALNWLDQKSDLNF